MLTRRTRTAGPPNPDTTLAQTGQLHGYGIVLHIQTASSELLRVEEGSLYPALHRMEQSGWISSEWAFTATKRKAKFYKLTAPGRKQLQEAEKSFEQLVRGIRAMPFGMFDPRPAGCVIEYSGCWIPGVRIASDIRGAPSTSSQRRHLLSERS